MNVNLLIDAIVRQTTVLIAQLATAAGTRATLAHTANQVFVDLVDELKAQGLGNKVIADMFGLSLRTYHHKVSRLSESATERGRSLWEALLAFVQERKTVSRTDVLLHFAHDEDLKVRGVLRDLVDSGLVFRSGHADTTIYRAANPDEYTLAHANAAEERFGNLVWIAVYRYGPVSRDELVSHVPSDGASMDAALTRLEGEARIRRVGSGGTVRYESQACVIPIGDPAGWEAAVFDHYQAVVTAICTKLRLGRRPTVDESVGGSTYGFEVWDGHPHRERVLSFLKESRDRAVAIRQLVATHNAVHEVGPNPLKVIAYVGQTLLGDEAEGDAR